MDHATMDHAVNKEDSSAKGEGGEAKPYERPKDIKIDLYNFEELDKQENMNPKSKG
jgi:hypothetical protein